METNNTPKDGICIMIEEPTETTKTLENKQTEAETEVFRDTYDFFPDSGF